MEEPRRQCRLALEVVDRVREGVAVKEKKEEEGEVERQCRQLWKGNGSWKVKGTNGPPPLKQVREQLMVCLFVR